LGGRGGQDPRKMGFWRFRKKGKAGGVRCNVSPSEVQSSKKSRKELGVQRGGRSNTAPLQCVNSTRGYTSSGKLQRGLKRRRKNLAPSLLVEAEGIREKNRGKKKKKKNLSGKDCKRSKVLVLGDRGGEGQQRRERQSVTTG